MRIGGEAGEKRLLAEPVQLRRVEPSFQEGPGVHAGSRVPLEVDVVATTRRVLSTEEVVEPDLIERGGRGVGRDVPADPFQVLVRPGHHHRCVPTDQSTDVSFQVLVAREVGLLLRRDRVDVVGRDHRGDAHPARPGVVHDPAQEESGPLRIRVDEVVEGRDPLGGLLWIDIGKLVLERVERSHCFLLPPSAVALAYRLGPLKGISPKGLSGASAGPEHRSTGTRFTAEAAGALQASVARLRRVESRERAPGRLC